MTLPVVPTKITADSITMVLLSIGVMLILQGDLNIAIGACLIVLGIFISFIRQRWNERRKEGDGQ